MNWIKRIFNWRKAPKATNEMKPVDIEKYFRDKSDYVYGIDPFVTKIKDDYSMINKSLLYTEDCLKPFIANSYIRVKRRWKRSPKNYSLYCNIYDPFNIKIINNSSICRNSFQKKNNSVIGNLYTLYQQYYGKENKN